MVRLALVTLLASALWAQTAGPRHGTLVIAGGGKLGGAILNRFIELAGGSEAPVVVVPTAAEEVKEGWLSGSVLARAGMTNLTGLHTRDRAEADRETFVEPLRRARGVWFEGGRQWRLVDSYLGTRTERELFALLDRGGVIGGTSAGATIQGSYLVRGAREGNSLMMAPGYEKGMGFLANAAIDQHLLARKRQDDMIQVVEAHPELLGIGIDESTAIVVQAGRFEVIGESKVAIYEAGRKYYFLSPGDRFDLQSRGRAAR